MVIIQPQEWFALLAEALFGNSYTPCNECFFPLKKPMLHDFQENWVTEVVLQLVCFVWPILGLWSDGPSALAQCNLLVDPRQNRHRIWKCTPHTVAFVRLSALDSVIPAVANDTYDLGWTTFDKRRDECSPELIPDLHCELSCARWRWRVFRDSLRPQNSLSLSYTSAFHPALSSNVANFLQVWRCWALFPSRKHSWSLPEDEQCSYAATAPWAKEHSLHHTSFE